MPVLTRLCRVLVAGWLLAVIAPAAFAADGPGPNPRQTWQLLDYVAVDYAGAIQHGKVVSPAEYAEMREFAATIRAQLAALPATPGQSGLVAQSDRLVAAVAAKADPKAVADLAQRLADDLLARYPVGVVPASPPDTAHAAPLYAQQCAACHGPTGHGDGPAAASLNPPPIAFTDADRAARRSPLALYEVISQGVAGTAMTSFSTLSEADRWALAFYVGSLAYAPESSTQGAALWREDAGMRRHIPTLEALTRSSEADLAKTLGDAQA